MSRLTRTVLLVVAASLPCLPAFGQAAGGPDVLKVVPAGAMGFVVANNMKDLAGKIDGFIKQIGVPAPGNVLDQFQKGLALGESFKPEGSMAVVLLDPQQYGLDLAGLVTGKPPAKSTPPPVVIYIPGKDPAKLFAAGKPTKEGETFTFTGTDGQPAYAAQVGDYVATSDSKKALEAAVAAKKFAAEALSAADKAVIAKNDVTAWVDMKMVAPIVDAIAVIAKMQAKADEGGMFHSPDVLVKKAVLDNLDNVRELLKQMTSTTLAGRLDKTGIVADLQLNFAPDSSMGKALAAAKAPQGPLLNRLPSMPYILALGVDNQLKTPKDLAEKQADSALSQPPFKDMSAENKAKLRDVILNLDEQVNAVQFYMGSITAGAGQFSLLAVIDCKSSDKLKEMLETVVTIAAGELKNTKDDVFKSLSVKYLKGVETVGDKKADAIAFDIAELAEMPEEARTMMKSILGEDKLRLLIAQPTDKLLVMNLGGGTGFLGEAVKVAAAGSGAIEKDPAVVKALAMLPNQRAVLALLNVANIGTLIKNISAAVGQPPPPINLTAATPFALSGSFDKTSAGISVFLPADTIADIVKAVSGLFGGMMGGMGGDVELPAPE